MRSKYRSSRPEGEILSARGEDLSVTAPAFLYPHVHVGVPLLEVTIYFLLFSYPSAHVHRILLRRTACVSLLLWQGLLTLP